MRIVTSVLFLFLLGFLPAYAQEANITACLRQIESGQIESAKAGYAKLKKAHPDDPSVMFLDAMLTQNGSDALTKYSDIYQKYPKSKYADASLYWVYSYYYALGSYAKASGYWELLKKNYPASSFLKSGENNSPAAEQKPSASAASQKSSAPAAEKKQVLPASPKKADETNKPPKTGSAPAKKNFSFTIQAGAFLDEKNAGKLMENFRESGYFSELKKKEIAGSMLTVVYVGRFETEKEAHKSLDQINTRYKLNGRVVRAEK